MRITTPKGLFRKISKKPVNIETSEELGLKFSNEKSEIVILSIFSVTERAKGGGQ